MSSAGSGVAERRPVNGDLPGLMGYAGLIFPLRALMSSWNSCFNQGNFCWLGIWNLGEKLIAAAFWEAIGIWRRRERH